MVLGSARCLGVQIHSTVCVPAVAHWQAIAQQHHRHTHEPSTCQLLSAGVMLARHACPITAEASDRGFTTQHSSCVGPRRSTSALGQGMTFQGTIRCTLRAANIALWHRVGINVHTCMCACTHRCVLCMHAHASSSVKQDTALNSQAWCCAALALCTDMPDDICLSNAQPGTCVGSQLAHVRTYVNTCA